MIIKAVYSIKWLINCGTRAHHSQQYLWKAITQSLKDKEEVRFGKCTLFYQL
jgi:hypothetical protein